MSENNKDTEVVSKKKKWLIPVIIGAVFAIAVLIVITAVVVTTAPKRALNKQLDLGEKYLSDLDYENAILAYEEALKIDPKCEEAYLKLSSIYISLAEEKQAAKDYEGASDLFNKAADVVQEGVNQTGSQQIKDELEEVNREIQENEELIEKSKVLELSAENFPDENLREYLSDKYDIDKNGVLDEEEIGSVTDIGLTAPDEVGMRYIDLGEVTNFKGIEHFPNLESLSCSPNFTGTFIDLSHNPKLKVLEIQPINLESIDISNNPELTYINLDETKIKTLDCSNNPNFVDIDAMDSELETLILGNQPKLEYLRVWGSKIKVIDISKCPLLLEQIKNSRKEDNNYNNGVQYVDSSHGAYLWIDKDMELVTE